MNIKNYRYFLIAAEELNFTRAAKKFSISQQALSQQIDSIENYYKTRLFDRDPPMKLTPAGECLYAHYSNILREEHALERNLAAITQQENRELAIGVSFHRGSVLLPYLLPEFARQYPDVNVRMEEHELSHIEEMLKKGKVDCIFSYQPYHSSDALAARAVLREYGVIVVPKKLFSEHFTEGEQTALFKKPMHTISDFAQLPFLRMAERTWYGRLLDKACQLEDIELRIILSSCNILMLLSCAAHGMGVAVCPSIYLQQLSEVDRHQVHVFKWDFSDAHKSSAILYSKNRYPSETMENFLQLAEKYIQNIDKILFDMG